MYQLFNNITTKYIMSVFSFTFVEALLQHDLN